jgi:hypothetical protein
MQPLDGHYRHRGVILSWDDAGVSVTRAGGRISARVPWEQIDGARQIGTRPGYVQLLVQGHVPPGDPRHDPFAIAVISDHDADRLVTSISWRVQGSPADGASTDDQGRRGSVAAWFRPRSRRG